MSQSDHITVNEECRPDHEINILLLGQTGIGKSTFVNSLANYLIYNNLEEAINNEIKVVIPTSFSCSDPETFEERVISLGDTTTPLTTANDQSAKQRCRSYVFPMHRQNLRLIDTPGMGDPKGSDEDKKHLFEILSYTSHYEHLNGICIFLKPNEERLVITFRLFLKQILHHLNQTACANVLFIFTNARSTFYMVGSSKNLLKVVIGDVLQSGGEEIPFSKENTFLIDNETLKYIAMEKNDLPTPREQVQAYEKSWDYTAREYARLLNYILTLPLHATANALTLSASEQLIRRLSRPVAGILRLILQNIQLAKEYKHQSRKKHDRDFTGFPQHEVNMETMKRPRLVCTSKKCMQLTRLGDAPQITYEQECYIGYHTGSIAQETIDQVEVAQCEVFDQQTGQCSKCNCSARKHMYITYKWQTAIKMIGGDNQNQDHQSLSETIEKHIDALRAEQASFEKEYKTLAKFLHVHAIHTFHDDMLDYLRVFVREERVKSVPGAANNDVMVGLAKIISKYEDDMSAFKKALANDRRSISAAEVPDLQQTFLLVGSLYRLPIYGAQLRAELAYLQYVEDIVVRRSETRIGLPRKAAKSKLMVTLNVTSP